MKSIIKHFKYGKYIFRHKWFVYVEAVKLGIVWRGLVHDYSKFLPSEWFAYSDYFYGVKDGSNKRDWKGLQKPILTGDDAFDYAWLLHQKRNPHHWQFWVLPEDNGGIKILPMPDKYRKEMLADWKGAGKAQGFTEPNECKNWYIKNKDKMTLHVETRIWIEKQLDI